MHGVWTSWSAMRSLVDNRNIVIYGRSDDWVHKILPHLPKPPRMILDRQESYWGSTYLGLRVTSPEELGDAEDNFVILAMVDFEEAARFLVGKGFRPGIDFACSPDFADLARANDLIDRNVELLVSISDYSDPERARGTERGGGLLRLNTLTGESSSVYSGSTRQLCRLDSDTFATIDFVASTLLWTDGVEKVEEIAQLDKPNFCGVAFHSRRGQLYCANAGSDEIVVIDVDSGNVVEVIQGWGAQTVPGGHHLNDLWIEDDVLWATCFSVSGAYKSGGLDGALLRMSLAGSVRSSGFVPVVQGLRKPHSPFLVDGKISYLDSLRGEWCVGTLEEGQQFPGFVRGIDIHAESGTVAIGSSFNLYYSERESSQRHVFLTNAGIFLVPDPQQGKGLARFIQLDGVYNIHDVLVV